LDICNDTSLESGADLAKLLRYFKEKVRETDFSRIMETPGSEESSVVLDFLEVYSQRVPSSVAARDEKTGQEGRGIAGESCKEHRMWPGEAAYVEPLN